VLLNAEIFKNLQSAGLKIGAEELEGFLAGVIAAPNRLHGGDWIELLVVDASAEMRKSFEALREEVERDFDPGFTAGPAPKERLEALRHQLDERALDGFVIPRTDEFQGEFVPARAERLRWLTGFTGSAGVAVVLKKGAALFVDGRYTLQVRDQVNTDFLETPNISENSPWHWVMQNLSEGERLGYDPWLVTDAERARYQAAVDSVGGILIAVESNPVDYIWESQPAGPLAPVVSHGLEYAGIGADEKRQSLAKSLTEAKEDAALISAPESVAWLLNIRGGDVPYTPLALSYAILMRSGDVRWFVDPRKLAPGLAASLGDGVSVEALEEIGAALADLGAQSAVVRLNKSVAPAYMVSRLEACGARVVHGEDPCAMPRACKNTTEVNGIRSAHIRDGAALTRFLAWLDREAPKGGVTEMTAAQHLQAYRESNDLIQDLSFRTISGAGANGAIVHYTVTPQTNRSLVPGELYLVDSGGQYLDGTTDVTRTVYIENPEGEGPSTEEKDRFTRVLQGHIALACARFPMGTSGSQIDALARGPLWDVGLDYDHGTGHGVGSYLGVHEGPHRISKAGGSVAFQPGMIVSNEPGFYKTGAFGIRIENLVVVTALEDAPGSNTPMKPWYGFETLTLAPIDRRLVDTALLTATERGWLDRYHARVYDTLAPLVDEETLLWLVEATRPVAH
jgi:Xaa-Pro aminopeptidase